VNLSALTMAPGKTNLSASSVEASCVLQDEVIENLIFHENTVRLVEV
jgi:hypothetical protein